MTDDLMEFRKNGDVILEGADKVWLALVKEMYGGSWEKAIDYHISLRRQRKRKEANWSEDLVHRRSNRRKYLMNERRQELIEWFESKMATWKADGVKDDNRFLAFADLVACDLLSRRRVIPDNEKHLSAVMLVRTALANLMKTLETIPQGKNLDLLKEAMMDLMGAEEVMHIIAEDSGWDQQVPAGFKLN